MMIASDAKDEGMEGRPRGVLVTDFAFAIPNDRHRAERYSSSIIERDETTLVQYGVLIMGTSGRRDR